MSALRMCWSALHTSPLAERVERIPFWTEELLASDDKLSAAIRAAIGTSYHPVCTAPMGPEHDEGAVVDQYCRVRGISNLPWSTHRSCPPSRAPTPTCRA